MATLSMPSIYTPRDVLLRVVQLSPFPRCMGIGAGLLPSTGPSTGDGADEESKGLTGGGEVGENTVC